MDFFPDELNLLYVSEIGEFLVDVDTRYVVKQFSEEEFFILYEPAVYTGKLSEIFELICYDYDKLPFEFQKKYEKQCKSFERINGNLYRLKEKKYNIETIKKK